MTEDQQRTLSFKRNSLVLPLPAAAASTSAPHPAAGRRGGRSSSPPPRRGLPVRAYRYEMLGFIDQCVERYLDLAELNEQSLRIVATPGIDDTAIPAEDFECPGRLAPSAASVLMKILYLARCCRFDLLHPVGMLAREVTKWTRACDKRLHRLVSYMHSTRDKNLEGLVGDSPMKGDLNVYSDASYADEVATSKSTSASFIALVGPNTFAPITALCKKTDRDFNILHGVRDRCLGYCLTHRGTTTLDLLGVCM